MKIYLRIWFDVLYWWMLSVDLVRTLWYLLYYWAYGIFECSPLKAGKGVVKELIDHSLAEKFVQMFD